MAVARYRMICLVHVHLLILNQTFINLARFAETSCGKTSRLTACGKTKRIRLVLFGNTTSWNIMPSMCKVLFLTKLCTVSPHQYWIQYWKVIELQMTISIFISSGNQKAHTSFCHRGNLLALITLVSHYFFLFITLRRHIIAKKFIKTAKSFKKKII